jgi:hypothetical protein
MGDEYSFQPAMSIQVFNHSKLSRQRRGRIDNPAVSCTVIYERDG